MAAVKSILVHAEKSAAGAELLTEAAAFAQARDAHLVALTVGAQPTLAYAGLPDIPPDVYASDLAEAREEVKATMNFVTERLTATGVSFEVRGTVVPAGEAGRQFARQARYADISIFARSELDRDWHDLVDATLFESGRPLILCPEGASLSRIGTRVAIAWQPGAEASRAVHDAIDVIPKAEDVRIVTVDPRVGAGGHGEEPGTDLATALARHGLPVTVDSIPRDNRTVAQAIVHHAEGIDADLIVSGAYGHSRLTEIILGGVTRDLMEITDRPLLMAH
ncbi:hypothetical protein DLJ53_19845 [Acuticoccus sediminis]|uniref:UspA domain-containing protein n=1 Tax=Acuticoccus sediminis TaxID=2184697 RepID=A0A8B2NPS4_9HYPH|nr:universal stress protein [Acuticoccus sediminis]RAH99987.1 hypothetical protein DLJ53_19845 [Acuticoccus sediminis]